MILEFFKPQTIAEAVALKDKFKDETVFMAGGTDVNCRDSKYKIEKVIGIEQLKLNEISQTRGVLSVGAGVTIQELLDSPKIPGQLTTAARHFVNRNIRNMATIGGNIASNNSSSNLIPILVALDAQLKIGGSATPLPVYEYVTQEMTRLIEAIMISSENLAKKYDLRKFSRAANDISIITAAVTFNVQNEKLSAVRVAVGGVQVEAPNLAQVGPLPGVQLITLLLGLLDQVGEGRVGLDLVDHQAQLGQHLGARLGSALGHHGLLVPEQDPHGVVERRAALEFRFQ